MLGNDNRIEGVPFADHISPGYLVTILHVQLGAVRNVMTHKYFSRFRIQDPNFT